MLHAELVVFPHPVSGKTIKVEVPLFEDFKNYLEFLERGGNPPKINVQGKYLNLYQDRSF